MVFQAVEEPPQLIGGLMQLQKKINYPKKAREDSIQGRVIIQFIVNNDGNVEQAKIVRGIGGGCDKEALRVVKHAQFEPGKQRGKAAPNKYSLPIVFRLPGDKGAVNSAMPDIESPQMNEKKMEVKNFSFSDDGTLTGRVVSKSTGDGLPGVNIVVKGTTQGTPTDKDENFTIEGIKQEAPIIRFSYVGYKSVQIATEIKG